MTWSLMIRAWDRVMDRLPEELSRKVSLGALDELAEHLGIKDRSVGSDEYILVKVGEGETVQSLTERIATLTAELASKQDALKHAAQEIAEHSDEMERMEAELAEARKREQRILNEWPTIQAKALSDPGFYTPRGDNYTEAMGHWMARASIIAKNRFLASLDAAARSAGREGKE